MSDSFALGVGISDWEIDFFGRIQSLKDAALAQYLATEEARKSAQISLVASVASTWLTLKTDTDLLVAADGLRYIIVNDYRTPGGKKLFAYNQR